jgi:FtsH-binding integral membrane protein
MIIDGELYEKHQTHRDAYKILIISACVTYSALALPFYERLGSPSLKQFPFPVAFAFLVLLATFGGIVLVAIIRQQDRLEAHGHLGLAGLWICFGIMGISTSGGRATAFALFLLAFSIAAVWSWWQRIGEPWWINRRARKAGER